MTRRYELRGELFQYFGKEQFPDSIPLNLKILSKAVTIKLMSTYVVQQGGHPPFQHEV